MARFLHLPNIDSSLLFTSSGDTTANFKSVDCQLVNMATTSKKRLQDMPPEGGYSKINFKRVPAASYFRGWAIIGGYLGVTAGAAYIYFLNYKKIHHHEIENRSAEFALYPLLLAERDREYLKQLRRNRDEEASLMANVEGWQVGTWYGEKIYETTDKLVEPKLQDYYIHAKFSDYARRAHIALKS